MKNLLIGAFSGYEWPQIAAWVKSANQCGFQGDKVAIAFNTSYDTVLKLFDHGVQVIVFDRDEENKRVGYASPIPVHVERFFHIFNFLKDRADEYDYVVTTDMRDVIFQRDPGAWLAENLGDKQIVAPGESILYRDEEWNRQNLVEAFGPLVFNVIKDKQVFNVGTLGGRAAAMRDLAFNIYATSVCRIAPIVDQSVFSVMMHSYPYRDIAKFVGSGDGWACQAGVSADPRRLAVYRPFLLAPLPVFDGKTVRTSTGEPYCLVHQYDRVPEWKAYFEGMYA